MKLSELVRVYNQLCDFEVGEVKLRTNSELEKITTLTKDLQLETAQQQLLNQFDAFDYAVTSLKNKIKNQILNQQPSYLLDSYKTYEATTQHKYEWFYNETENQQTREKNIQQHVNNILNTALHVSEQGADLIKHRILKHSGWQNTTMVLHPAKQLCLENLVSNDPLYLVDESYDLIKPVLAQFNSAYQNRLRTYIIKENTSDEILAQLPDNQFGLILAWDYFNYRPFEVIRTYMNELHKKLRPGGNLLMTYNDCDRWKGVMAVEKHSASYTPGLLIRGFAERLGFEETFIWHNNGPWTWVEFRKPGKWSSLRGGQAMAKIIPK